MTKRLLIIDDDMNLLLGLKRQFRKRFDLETVNSGQEAIDYLKKDKTIAVVVSDMRMPGLSGLETLKQVREINPDIVRIMLTGNADQQTAVDAVNEGAIFRFFNKPCDNEVLAHGIEDAFRQYDMITAEKVLLEKTLAGTVKFLLDLMSFSHPEAFARSTRIRTWCKDLVEPLEIKNTWRLDFSAMLLPLAELILPSDLLQKKEKGEPLSEAELDNLKQAPKTIQGMLKQIPRLEEIADIVALANATHEHTDMNSIPLEAKILRILIDLAKRTSKLVPSEKSFTALVKNIQNYDDGVFKTIQQTMLEKQQDNINRYETVVISLPLLRPGQTLLSDIVSDDNRMLLSHGAILTQAHIEKLKSIARTVGVSQEIKVARLVRVS